MNYLATSEYEAYGLEATTHEAWVGAASVLLDAHCRRKTLGVAEYTERLRVSPGGRCRLSYLPLQSAADATSPLVSLRARYGRQGGEFAEAAQAFALPGSWVQLDIAHAEVCGGTGELQLPWNALGLQFDEVEATYTAGLDPLPEAVKHACAQVVRNAQAMPALNVRSSSIDRVQLEYFRDSLLDASVCAMVSPYVAVRMGG